MSDGVFDGEYRLEMLRVDAGSVPAAVVDLLPDEERPDEEFVGDAVCVTSASAEADTPVARRDIDLFPGPTAVLFDVVSQSAPMVSKEK